MLCGALAGLGCCIACWCASWCDHGAGGPGRGGEEPVLLQLGTAGTTKGTQLLCSSDVQRLPTCCRHFSNSVVPAMLGSLYFLLNALSCQQQRLHQLLAIKHHHAGDCLRGPQWSCLDTQACRMLCTFSSLVLACGSGSRCCALLWALTAVT